MKKITAIHLRALCLALVVVLFFSCQKNDIKKVEIDNQFAISLFSDTVRIGDFIGGMDSTMSDYIQVSEDGIIHVCYSDSIINAVVASDILAKFDDVTFETSSQFELPVLPPSPVPVPIELPLDNLFSVPFEYDGYEINFVKIKTGKIFFNITTNFTILEELSLVTDNIKLADGSSLELNLNVDDNGMQTVEINLAECEIIPVDGNIVFSGNIKATYSTEGVGGTYNFDMSGGLTDIQFQSIDGAIPAITFDFRANKDLSLNFPNLYGDLKVQTPEFSIKYINSFGFKADAFIDSLYLTDGDGNMTSIVEDWNQLEIMLNSTGENFGLIDELDDALVDEINILDDYNNLTFKGTVILDCDEVASDMITDESHIDIIGNVALPLEFDIQSLSYIDTLDFNLSLGEQENGDTQSIHVEDIFDELEFKFVFENALPIQIKPQMYILENGTVIDSLFEGDSFIHACFDNTPIEDILIVKVTDNKLVNVQLADQLMLDINLSSLGNDIVINTDGYFNLRLGLKTKTTEIYVDDFNF